MSFRVWAFAVIFLIASEGMANTCRHLFYLELKLNAQESHVYELIKIKDTDRGAISSKFGPRTVREYLEHMLKIQIQQVELINWKMLTLLNADQIAEFRRRLEANVQENRLHLSAFSEESKSLVITEVFSSKDPAYQSLQSQILTFVIRSNTILAELVAALHFEKIISTEQNIEAITGEHWPRIRKNLEVFPSKDVENFNTRRMDVVAREGKVTYWVEVKYLGRNQEYSEISGQGVYTKMLMMKHVADMMPGTVKVVLMTVGPGRLTKRAETRYEDMGVAVISI